MKTDIINDFTEKTFNPSKEKKETKKINIKSGKGDIMNCVDKYINKVKILFHDDLDLWGNRIVDVLITELQNKYDMSYEKAENHVLKCIEDNKLPKPIRARYNYNICRELDSLPDVQIVI